MKRSSKFLKIFLAIVMLAVPLGTAMVTTAFETDENSYDGVFEGFYEESFDYDDEWLDDYDYFDDEWYDWYDDGYSEYEWFGDDYELDFENDFGAIEFFASDDEAHPAIEGYVPELMFAEDMLPYVEEDEIFLPIEPRNAPAAHSGLVQFVLEPVQSSLPPGVTMAQARAAAFNSNAVYHPLFANATTTAIATAVNGRYGRDAMYLGQSANGNRFRVMIAGFEGYVNRVGHRRTITIPVNGVNRTFDVTANAVFLPFSNYPSNSGSSSVRSVSHYVNRGGELFRYLTNNVTGTGGFVRFLTGPSPSWMTQNTRYYSFDGIYFYRNPRNIRVNGSGAVNANNPFFNYFQYLSFRAPSTVTAAQLNTFLTTQSNHGINVSNSVMRNQGGAFIGAQERYGVNALLMYAKAMHESFAGTSSIARNNNNLFGQGAIDAAPGTNAWHFATPAASINDLANGWLSRGYLWPDDWRYAGPHVGHKGSGMNVRYATDPYWGQKIAGWAFRIDRTRPANSRDINREQIAIRRNTSSVAVTNAGGTTLYTANRHQFRYFAFLVTGTGSNNRLRILTDPTIANGVPNRTTRFNRNNAIGFIPNSNVWLTGAGNPATQPPTTNPPATNPPANNNITPPTHTVSPSQTATVTASSLNFRRGPGLNYASIRFLSQGTTVTILGTNANGTWSYIRESGQYGWVSTDFLRVQQSANHQISAMVQTGVTRMNTGFYEGPGTGYSRIRVVNGSTNLRITGRTGNWYRVNVGGTVGFIRQSRVARTRQNAVVTTNNAHVRAGRGTSHASLTRVPRGQRVTVARRATSWSRITVNGHTGWIRNSDISMENAMRPGRTTTNNVAIHTRPRAAATVRRRLPVNTQLMVVQRTTDGWSQVRIQHDGGTLHGWVRTNQIQRRVHTRRMARDGILRSGPGTSYSNLRTVPRNTNVTVRSRVGNWYHVHFTVNGRRHYGWQHRDNLQRLRLP